MARVTIEPTRLLGETPVPYTPTAGDAVNGMQVAKERLAIIRVENTGAVSCTVSLLPGDPQQGAFMTHPNAGMDVTVPAGEIRMIGEIEAARFSQGQWYYLDLDQAAGVILGAIYI